MSLCIYMVIRNASAKQALFEKVVSQAAKISHQFYIVNHGSDDNTSDILTNLEKKLQLKLEVANEPFEGTMDDMKAKHYKILKEKYGKERNFIFILDWDEVITDSLAEEINQLKWEKDVYLINRHTYFIKHPIDKNAFLPLLFETNSVEVNTFAKFHDLYRIHSQNTQKLSGILEHYSFDGVKDAMNKNIFYAQGEAQDLFEKEPHLSGFSVFFRFLFEAAAYFAYTLFYHANFLHTEGWLYSFNWCAYKLDKYLFYLELQAR